MRAWRWVVIVDEWMSGWELGEWLSKVTIGERPLYGYIMNVIFYPKTKSRPIWVDQTYLTDAWVVIREMVWWVGETYLTVWVDETNLSEMGLGDWFMSSDTWGPLWMVETYLIDDGTYLSASRVSIGEMVLESVEDLFDWCMSNHTWETSRWIYINVVKFYP